MVTKITCKKFLGNTAGLEYGANPQYMGDIEALISFDDGQRLKAVLFIDWCPSAHKTWVIIDTDTAPTDVLKTLQDTDRLITLHGNCNFKGVKFKHFSIQGD